MRETCRLQTPPAPSPAAYLAKALPPLLHWIHSLPCRRYQRFRGMSLFMAVRTAARLLLPRRRRHGRMMLRRCVLSPSVTHIVNSLRLRASP